MNPDLKAALLSLAPDPSAAQHLAMVVANSLLPQQQPMIGTVADENMLAAFLLASGV